MRRLFLAILFLGIGFGIFGCNKEPRVFLGTASVRVEVAQTQTELARGLQYRSSLAKDSGMLFIFPQNVEAMFWMKNTLIPLDIIWLDENKKIVHIEKNVPPCLQEQCPVYGPSEQVVYVLEVNAGFADANDIAVGDYATFSFVEKK